MSSYHSAKKLGIEHLILFLCVAILIFAMTSCDSGGDDDDNGGSNPSPSPSASPSPGPTASPSPSPSPSPEPEGSILEPGGTLAEVPETFDYVGEGDPRQSLDYYAISGLDSQAAALATREVDGLRPAIVFLHGGAWLFGDKSDIADTPIVLNAAELGGFHVISVGYRLATEAAWPAQIHDANAAIRWIKQNSEALGVYPDKLILVGGSAGAHIAAAAAAGSDVPDLQGSNNLEPPTTTEVALAVLIFGAYNMNMIVDDGLALVADTTCSIEDLGPGIFAVQTLLGCPSINIFDPFENCSQNDLDSASPELLVDSTDPPMYLAHGRDDCTVPYLQTVGMGDALDSVGVPFMEMIFEGGEHDVDTLDLSVDSIIEFIDDNVSP